MLLEGFLELFLKAFGDGVGFAPLENLNGLAGRINDDPAIGALGDMGLQLLAKLGVHIAVQVVGDFAQQLATGNQSSLPF